MKDEIKTIKPIKSVELCIEDSTGNNSTSNNSTSNNSIGNNSTGSPVNSLESSESSMQSLSTYDSMMQTLNDELNNRTTADEQCDNIDLMDFEDMDFFKMDCATAMSFDYEMNYTVKQLKHIAGYYGIKHKTRKVDVIQDIVAYETDAANGDTVTRRKRMFYYMDALKNDEYFKSFMMI